MRSFRGEYFPFPSQNHVLPVLVNWGRHCTLHKWKIRPCRRWILSKFTEKWANAAVEAARNSAGAHSRSKFVFMHTPLTPRGGCLCADGGEVAQNIAGVPEDAMASRFLRGDLHRTLRPSSLQTNVGSALYFAASREHHPPAPASRTVSGRVTGLASPGWRSTSFSQPLGHVCCALSTFSGGGVANTGSSINTSSRFGSANSVTSSTSASVSGLHNTCSWRGAGGVVPEQLQAGRRYLSSRKGKAGQT